jgi:hypothetical protein
MMEIDQKSLQFLLKENVWFADVWDAVEVQDES